MRYRFAFVLFVLVIAAVCARLGFWQLDRAAQKTALMEQYHHNQQAPLLQIGEVNDLVNISDWRYRRVQMQGHFDNAHSFLLDNKLRDGVPGYEVITPFILENTPQIVLINRGWIERGATRQIVPAIATVDHLVLLTVLMYFPDKHPFLLGENIEAPGQWPARIQQIDLVQMGQAMGKTVEPWLGLLVDDKWSTGFVQDWQINTRMPPSKHHGYAVQWFGLAIMLLVLISIFYWKTRTHEQ